MKPTPPSSNNTLAAIVNDRSTGTRLGRRWPLVAGVLIVIAAAVIAGARQSSTRAAAPAYGTETITRGTLTVRVTATGNLRPTNEVDVGSEVSGLVETVFVDDNDHVKAGQVLAKLDTSKLLDQVVNAKAAVASAEARVLQSAASVKESTASLARLQQVAELSGGKVPSKAELEAAEATAARARADQASAMAAVEQSRATLRSAETNLAKASVRSPIDGIVLSREIEPGQTVAASFQAPTLFTLAEDLAAMRLEVDVDEADVGTIRDNQTATFTVDAYPSRQYPARITRVGYGSQTKEGVVFYKAVLTVNNDDLSLRPGMTATADITTVERHDVLLVPNAALRFAPPTAPAAQQGGAGIVSSLLPRPPGMGGRPATSNGTAPKNGAGQVWIVTDGVLKATRVAVGHTDGRVTEVSGEGLAAGLKVAVEGTGGLS